jgi:hypothetical protein
VKCDFAPAELDEAIGHFIAMSANDRLRIFEGVTSGLGTTVIALMVVSSESGGFQQTMRNVLFNGSSAS